MQAPLQITMRNIDHSHAVEARIRQKAEKLDFFSDKIISCHIVLELDQARKHHGKLFNVRLHLTIPGKELVVNHNLQENLYEAIRDAFDDMTRKLEEAMQILRGNVKNHAAALEGEIVRIFKEEDFGFIQAPSGEEFYFNAINVIHPSFKQLKVGTHVHFVEREGEAGPHATRVKAIR